jgi:hypothetical protein
VVTAVLVNLPVVLYLVVRLFREGWVGWPRALLAFVAVPMGIVILIPALFWVGRAV